MTSENGISLVSIKVFEISNTSGDEAHSYDESQLPAITLTIALPFDFPFGFRFQHRQCNAIFSSVNNFLERMIVLCVKIQGEYYQ
jgi:hypothetical protein